MKIIKKEKKRTGTLKKLFFWGVVFGMSFVLLQAPPVVAASGKCQVVKVNGARMVIECNEQARGFAIGNKIKIKTDREREQARKKAKKKK